MTTVYQANCDYFDNSRTGFHKTAEAAESAFWNENIYSDSERKLAIVYTNEFDSSDAEVTDDAHYLAGTGVSSPALGIEATA